MKIKCKDLEWDGSVDGNLLFAMGIIGHFFITRDGTNNWQWSLDNKNPKTVESVDQAKFNANELNRQAFQNLIDTWGKE